MLYEKNDSQSYVLEFKKRFTNFAEKAPLLLSFSTSPKNVSVVDESTETVYQFDWDYTIPVKSFIHGIKTVLQENCYPILRLKVVHILPMSEEAQLKLASQGTPLDEIPITYESTEYEEYMIEKVIVYKDIFIIRELATDKVYRYKMNKSSVFFLKKLRNGQLSPEEAALYFFNHSQLLNEIVLQGVKDESAKTGV